METCVFSSPEYGVVMVDNRIMLRASTGGITIYNADNGVQLAWKSLKTKADTKNEITGKNPQQ